MSVSQRAFVRSCYDFYKEADLTPGNPEDGEWQKAHYPLPKTLGTRWVWLLKEHHAIQAVLQSEEVGHPALWSWEKKYLVGKWAELLPLYEKWLTVKNSLAGKASVAELTAEELSARGKHAAKAPKSPFKVGHRVGSAPATDKQKEAARESANRLHKDRYRCTVTGKESTWTGLINFQRARGIDTSNRIKINPEQ
jgi:hypothetical protein